MVVAIIVSASSACGRDAKNGGFCGGAEGSDPLAADRQNDRFSAQSHSFKGERNMWACKVWGLIPYKRGLFLTKIVFQNRRIDFCQSLNFRNRDVFIHHMRGRANAAEFEDWAIGLNEARVRCAAAR